MPIFNMRRACAIAEQYPMISLSTGYTRLLGTSLSITGAGTISTVIGVKSATTHLTGLLVSRCPLGQIPVLIPIRHTAPVTTEGFYLAVLCLIQGSTALPAAGLIHCNAWHRYREFLLSAGTG